MNRYKSTKELPEKLPDLDSKDIEAMIRPRPYDSAFRTIKETCGHLILPLLNEIFGEHYIPTDQIIVQGDIHMVEDPESPGRKRRETDSALCVVDRKGESKGYHIECETDPDDKTIILRMFEYGSAYAFQYGSVLQDNKLEVLFPNAAVVYLRSGPDTPDNLTICLKVPGDSVEYKVPIVKMKAFTIDDIFHKDLYFLIPFYIFNWEDRLDSILENDRLHNQIMNELSDINRRIEELSSIDSIDDDKYNSESGLTTVDLQKIEENREEHWPVSAYEKRVLLEQAAMVIANLIKDQEIREEAVKNMFGTIYVSPTMKVREEGIKIGEEKNLFSLIYAKIKRSLPLAQIAQEVEKDEKAVKPIYDAIRSMPEDLSQEEAYNEYRQLKEK